MLLTCKQSRTYYNHRIVGVKSVGVAFFFAVTILFAPIPMRVSAEEPHPVGSGMYRQQLPEIILEAKAVESFVLVIGEEPMMSGDIRIVVEERDDMQMQVTLTLPAPDRETAEEMFKFIRTKTEENSRGTIITLELDKELAEFASLERARIRIRLALPLETSLELDTKYLQIRSEGALSELRIIETVAPVRISGMRGRAEIRSSGATLKISDHIGALDLLCRGTEIKLTDIEIPREFTSPRRNARIETTDETISFTRYDGPLNMRTTRARIRGRDVALRGANNVLENSGGRIDIRIVSIEPETEIEIVNVFENILLRLPPDVNASIILESDPGGMISVDGVAHEVVRALDYLLELYCGNGSSRITVSTDGGGEIFVSESL